MHVRGRPGTDERRAGTGRQCTRATRRETALHNWRWRRCWVAVVDASAPPPAPRRRRVGARRLSPSPPRRSTLVAPGRHLRHRQPGRAHRLRSPSRPPIMQTVGSGGGTAQVEGRRQGQRPIPPSLAGPPPMTHPLPWREEAGCGTTGGPGREIRGGAGGGFDGWAKAAEDQTTQRCQRPEPAEIRCSQPSPLYRRR